MTVQIMLIVCSALEMVTVDCAGGCNGLAELRGGPFRLSRHEDSCNRESFLGLLRTYLWAV